jgi:HSP20 family protein
MQQQNYQEDLIDLIENDTTEKSAEIDQWLTAAEEGQLLLDVFFDDKNLYIKSTMAGVEATDIEISVQNDLLTIRGKRNEQEKIDPEKYYYQECYWGSFSRSIILPTSVKADKIKASLKNGVLTITLPKLKKKTLHKITVTEEQE